MIQFAGGQAHHVIKVPVDASDPDVANPFLDAIGTSLVKRVIMLDVVVNLVIGQVGKVDDARVGEPLITRWARPDRARNMR